MTSQPDPAGNPSEPVTPLPAPDPEEPGVLLHSPISLRSAALLVIAVLMSLAALRMASAVFIPLVMGVMVSYALTPLVNRMVQLHIPRTPLAHRLSSRCPTHSQLLPMSEHA